MITQFDDSHVIKNNLTSLEISLTELGGYLSHEQIWFKKDHLIKFETYFQTGGVVKIYICPQTVEKFTKAVSYLQEKDIGFKVIGFTSNVLLFDQIQYSVIISTKNLTNVEIDEHYAHVDCGFSLQDFVRIAITNGAGGFEGLEGIPGSIGGGVFMNAGAYGYSIAENIVSVDYIDSNGNVRTIDKEQCDFGHRKSLFKRTKSIILRVRFKLKPGSKEEIASKVETYHIARHSYQEFVYPNLGSMFSVRGDLYRELLRGERNSRTYVYYFLKFLLKNPVSKFVARKKPSNVTFNKLLESQLKHTNYTPSKKSLNILINDGSTSTRSHFEYMLEFKKRLGEKFDIENEPVLEPAYKVEADFHTLYQDIKSNIKPD